MSDINFSAQAQIHLGTHGEDYRSWMSNPVFFMIGGGAVVSVLLAILSLAVLHIVPLAVVFLVITAGLLAMLCWMTWIRKQYAFDGGGMMEAVHRSVLAHLDFDGQGRLLDVGCGSGALSIRAALTWPEAQIVGIDYWGAVYNYSQRLCERNAVSEGVGERCIFQSGDANKLHFSDESFDAVVSNYVYHNIVGADKQALLMESLRVLKKGGVFALNDAMKPKMYGDMAAFAQGLRDMGYVEVQLVDTGKEVFGSHLRASLMMLGHSQMIVGRK
ncbi:MAG: class I SAM-dependent methyltransferase [Peptococcaceae bacterium]|nr:class I SAM-dependent methyltransferase [Peptococcaceae bacterium]